MHLVVSECKMNVHKRCEKNVANNCSTKTKDLALMLKELGLLAGKAPQNAKRPKVTYLLHGLLLWSKKRLI